MSTLQLAAVGLLGPYLATCLLGAFRNSVRFALTAVAIGGTISLLYLIDGSWIFALLWLAIGALQLFNVWSIRRLRALRREIDERRAVSQ